MNPSFDSMINVANEEIEQHPMAALYQRPFCSAANTTVTRSATRSVSFYANETDQAFLNVQLGLDHASDDSVFFKPITSPDEKEDTIEPIALELYTQMEDDPSTNVSLISDSDSGSIKPMTLAY